MAINPLQIPQIGTITPDITPTLANLVNTINKGQQRQTLADLGRGLADGTIDYKQAAGKLASTGDLASTLSLLKLGQEQDASKAFSSSLGSLYGGGGAPQPSVGSPVAAGPTVPNDSNAIPGTVGMNQRLADLSQDFIQDNPGTSMTSGFRSNADQARLYANRGSNPNPVAPPGSSNHERGLAVDIGGMTPEQRALLPQYGLAQPVANDPPHVELAGNTQVPAALPGNSQPGGGLSQRAMQLIRGLSIPNLPQADRELGGKLLAAELDQSKLPDAVKQYVFARSQDPSIGSFTDWTRANKAAGKTEVNVDTRGQNAFAKEGGQVIAKRFAKLSEEGDTATQDLALVGQLRDIGTRIKTGGVSAVQGTLANYGIKLGDNVGEVEAYNSIIDKLTPSQRVPGSGATSDFEGKMFKNALPKLINTPQGNEIISNTLAGLAQSKIDRAKIAEAALAGDISPSEAMKQLRALPSPYANFKAFAKGGFKADPNAPARTSAPQQQRTQMAPQDIDASLANARAAIARNPAARDGIIRKLRENGLDPSGL